MVPMNREKDKEPKTRTQVQIFCEICNASTSDTQLLGFFRAEQKFFCSTCLEKEVGNVDRWRLDDISLLEQYQYPEWVPPMLQTFVDVPKPAREYWYFLTWTHNDNHTIENVWSNILRFKDRSLGFLALEAVKEHGTESGRDHYHMRMKLSRPLKKQKVKHYEKAGHIDFVTIRKHTQENWENLEGYMSKESEIIDLMHTEA